MLTSRRPLRVAVLCSRRAPGLSHLLTSARGHERAFDIVCVVSTEDDCADLRAAAELGATTITHDIRAFYADRQARVYHDAAVRAEYDAATVRLLEPFAPDVVLLDGYLYLLTASMLAAFPNRIINLHFSDLTLRRADGRPAYAGIRAVRDAVFDGRTETRATVHLVDAEPDDGAPILLSWPFAVPPLVEDGRRWRATEMLKAYAFAHQEWMLRAASGPMLRAALELVAEGRLDLDALACAPAASATPWTLGEDGVPHPPAAAAAPEDGGPAARQAVAHGGGLNV